MRKLKALGVQLAFGNVGTGCVSSSDLPLYTFDVIKSDRQCIHDLDGIYGGHATVRAILALGKTLGLRVTAEGMWKPGSNSTADGERLLGNAILLVGTAQGGSIARRALRGESRDHR